MPVRSVNWVRIFPALDAEGRDCLVAVMGQQADGFMVVKIDPVTGETDQVTATVPSAHYPTATLLSRSGVIYIGAAYAGCLFCYDPKDWAIWIIWGRLICRTIRFPAVLMRMPMGCCGSGVTVRRG